MDHSSKAADGALHADRAATASYIADLTRDLATMARGRGLDTLGYILEMARLEAEATANRD